MNEHMRQIFTAHLLQAGACGRCAHAVFYLEDEPQPEGVQTQKNAFGQPEQVNKPAVEKWGFKCMAGVSKDTVFWCTHALKTGMQQAQQAGAQQNEQRQRLKP